MSSSVSGIECWFCDTVKEVERGEISIAMACMRSLGLATSVLEGVSLQDIRETLCLRHAHALHEHMAWTMRNVGTPEPWPEEEPRI